jgi:leucyl aminopeptidase
MPSVSIVDPSEPIAADAVVIGLTTTPAGPRPAAGAKPVDALLGRQLASALKAVGATGRPDEVIKIPTLGLAPFPLVVTTGLGDQATDAEQLRRAAGAALRTLTGARHVHIAMDGPSGALAEGALLGSYAFTAYKSGATPPALRRITISGAAQPLANAQLRHARVVAEAVCRTRDLVNTPPNDLYPQTFADAAA